jgi:hypothetical protein
MDVGVIVYCAELEAPTLRDTARRILEAEAARFGVPLGRSQVLRRRARGGPAMHVMAAADELGANPGDRFELTSTDLIVKGSLATYRIDLATANVRLDRTGRWLSFGTRPTRNTSQYQVPGLPAPDDDVILHRILIRAAILADDDQLAGRDLLRQIRG